MTLIATARLKLRPLTMNDREEMHTIWTSPGVRRFLWDDEVIPLETTTEIIIQNQQRFEDLGHGIWSVLLNESLVGFAGYWPFRDQQSLELLFGVATEYWQSGIATEAAEAVIRYGFQQLDFPSVIGSTDAQNTASVCVMEKLGMQVTRRVVVDGLDTIFCCIEREDWQRGAASSPDLP